jgi:hypothetical protein
MVNSGMGAEFHSPSELLAGAAALLASPDPRMMRVVVLEAITALEAFIHATVFALLESKMDPLLVKWLEDKTRMDFDSRLSVLTPVATGQRVDTKSALWNDYKKAKEIRNKVTHGGRKVTREEAKSVFETVRRWMAFLNSTAELDLALVELKRELETAPSPITNERDGVLAVQEFFQRTRNANAVLEPTLPAGKADLVLTFDPYRVVVEVKFAQVPAGAQPNGLAWAAKATEQVLRYLGPTETNRGAAVIFFPRHVPETLNEVLVQGEGKVSVIGIRAAGPPAG